MGQFLVLQTDFGLGDGAVSSMYGVAYNVSAEIEVQDLTHDIPAYDIKAAAYRLYQTISYWPEGTVFVSVVDPGVGGQRKSVVCLTETGHYVITPDNGTLTFLAYYVGIKEVRLINETVSRLAHSSDSHTFHGRDIYAYNGARLASGQVTFAELGESFSVSEIAKLPLVLATHTKQQLTGTIDILDSRFGSLWTNIPNQFVKELAIKYQDQLQVTIHYQGKQVYQAVMPFVKSFAEVEVNQPLLYINSLLNLAVAVNQGSFAELFKIGTGNDWTIDVTKL